LLATLNVAGKIVFGLMFIIMVFVWCLLANGLSRHARIAHTLQTYGHIIMPVVLLLLGIFILVESGTIPMLFVM
jgi:cadmium resistance protein CadD (predicted permease)